MSAYRSESVVRVDFTLEVEDFRDVGRDPQTAQRIRYLMLSVAALVLLCTGSFIWQVGVIMGLVLGAVLMGLMFWLTLRSVRPSPATRFGDRWDEIRHQKVEATEEHFEVADRASKKRLAWELVAHFSELERYFLVYISPNAYHLVPKRAFATPEAETTFRRLLEDRVPAGGAERIVDGSRAAWPKFAFAITIVTLLIASVFEVLALAVTS